MRRWLLFLSILVVMVCLAMPRPVLACPNCRDAVSAASDVPGEEDEESGNSPAAYNHSIYLMIGVPYLSLAVVILLICRGLKKNADYLRANEAVPKGSAG